MCPLPLHTPVPLSPVRSSARKTERLFVFFTAFLVAITCRLHCPGPWTTHKARGIYVHMDIPRNEADAETGLLRGASGVDNFEDTLPLIGQYMGYDAGEIQVRYAR